MRYVIYPLAFVFAGIVLSAVIVAFNVGIAMAFVVFAGLDAKAANVAAQFALPFLVLFGAGVGVAHTTR